MAKMGRPPIEIDKHQLESFMRMKPTLVDTAVFFKCSEDKIGTFIRKHYDLTFTEFRDQKMVATRHDLARQAIKMALSGDRVMLIFCLKNFNGWTDNVQASADDNKPFKLAYDTNNKHA